MRRLRGRAASASLVALGLAVAPVAPARAQAQEPTDDAAPPPLPDPDPTRLDVERLPPRAIAATRAMYAHGPFLEAWLGARGLVGGAGRLLEPGPLLVVGAGWEILDFLWARLAFEASWHSTAGPAPPTATTVELLGGALDVRLQWNATARLALWLSGELAVHWVTGDALQAWGVDDAHRAGVAYGGSLGFDVHLDARHTSLGLVGGARRHPALRDPAGGAAAVAVHGAAYLRHVFDAP